MTEEINKGCEFQSDCIEYKDISYLKIMPICAIHELSIACHDKVNKCKYYKLYKQLKRLEFELKVIKADYEASEQENKELKDNDCEKCKHLDLYMKYKSALEEIKSAIVEYLPKKQGDYNFSKSLNPVQYALLEYIQIQINEVLQ